MPKTAYTLSWSATAQAYALSGLPDAASLSPAPDTPAWFAWLAGATSFAFSGRSGAFTARKEAMRRGDRYWYAYLRTGHKLSKRYLGKTADLTLARLEQVAGILHAERVRHSLPSASAQGHTPKLATSEAGQLHPAAALPSDPFNPLVSTKVHAPRPSAQLLSRPRLTARLQEGLEQALILVSAPAGFGKTTVVAQWLVESGREVAWLSLDEEDDDPLRFLWAFLAALRTLDPAIGASVQALLASRPVLEGLSLPAVFTLFINELADREPREFLVVLDDYHSIAAQPIQRAMAHLVAHCPPNVHLVLVTRADPPLPLAQLRVRGQLCELRTADLQWDEAEATRFLRSALGDDLEPAAITAITGRTEGWIAGLHLASLALQGQCDLEQARRFVADFNGTHRHIIDYLSEEVLARQPEAVQFFLLRTSILDRLAAPLCAEVTENSEDASAAMLAAVERANLFLIPLDGQRGWYRYHALWAEVLRVLLAHRIGPAGVAALYVRASRWYKQHGLPAEAVVAAMDGSDFEHAVELIELNCIDMLARDQYLVLRRWIERLPASLWSARPLVCLIYAYSLFIGAEYEAYAAPLREAERLYRQEANSIGVGMSQALHALAATMRGDGRPALASGREALALLPEGNILRILATVNLGVAYAQVGERMAAWQTVTAAQMLLEHAGAVTGQLANRMQMGSLLAWEGRFREATEHYQWVIETAVLRRSYAIETMIRLAIVRYEQNELDDAETLLAHAIGEARETADDMLLARGVLSLGHLTQARIRKARGEPDAADALFAQAATLARQGVQRQYQRSTESWQVRWWLAQGQTEAVERWRETCSYQPGDPPIYEHESAALTLARVLIARGDAEAAPRLLEGFLALARAQGRLGSELEIMILLALAAQARGRLGEAADTLARAIGVAEPAGYVRLFVDEGPPMATLLRVVQARWKGRRSAGYVGRLLSLIHSEHEQPGERVPRQAALSGRERAVVRLLAAGRTVEEIAAELVVSPNTIKTQISSLYRKLDVHSREAALAEAARQRYL